MFIEECPWEQRPRRRGEGSKSGEREKLSCMELTTGSASSWGAQKSEWVFRVVLSQTEMVLQHWLAIGWELSQEGDGLGWGSSPKFRQSLRHKWLKSPSSELQISVTADLRDGGRGWEPGVGTERARWWRCLQKNHRRLMPGYQSLCHHSHNFTKDGSLS